MEPHPKEGEDIGEYDGDQPEGYYDEEEKRDKESDPASVEDEGEKPSKQQDEEVPRKWQWATPLIEGVPPSQRGGHSATLSGASIIIFGVFPFATRDHSNRVIITQARRKASFI
jgi:host cell factor